MFAITVDRNAQTGYHLATTEHKKIMTIDESNLFDLLVDTVERLYEAWKKKTIDHGDFYTTECILDFVQFRKNYKTIAVGLSKDSLYMLTQV